MANQWLTEPIAEHVWNLKYRLQAKGQPAEASIRETWSRVALALSNPEPHHRDDWCERFASILRHFRFLPGGRIYAGAGAGRRATLFSAFVMAPPHDALDAIFAALGEAMVTLQAGGAIACDFSLLRPAGMAALASGNVATGPVSFLAVWDQACATLAAGAARHGAVTAALRCDHPDIESFVDAKRAPGALRHLSLSVLVSDDFMQAVAEDGAWPLVFPLAGRAAPDGGMVCERIWADPLAAEPCLVARTVPARALWDRIARAACDGGEPGVLFIDRVRRADNLGYAERISAASPGGEVALPPHGACALGALNLTQFVRDPFGARAHLDLSALGATAAMATRMLDNVYELPSLPLRAQARVAHAARRVGLGLTGLADALAMLGVQYGSEASFDLAESAMRAICHAAYRASAALAKERGAFPEYRAAEYLSSDFVLALPNEIHDAIWKNGIRNSHLTAIAPAASVSLLANNVSSGIAPLRACQMQRSVPTRGGNTLQMAAADYAWNLFRQMHGAQAALPSSLAEAQEVDPRRQLQLRARLQGHVDQSMEHAIEVPPRTGADACGALFTQAYQLGLKGCSLSRADGRRGGAPSGGADSPPL